MPRRSEACGLASQSVVAADAAGRLRVQTAGAHVFDIAERVVDGNHVDAVLLACGPAHEAADSAEATDTHLRHGFWD